MSDLGKRIIFTKNQIRMPKKCFQSKQNKIQSQNQQNENYSHAYQYHSKLKNNTKLNDDKSKFNDVVQEKNTKKRFEPSQYLDFEKNHLQQQNILQDNREENQYSIFDQKVSQSVILSQPTKRRKIDNNQSFSYVKKKRGQNNNKQAQLHDEQVKSNFNKNNYNSVVWIQQERIKYTFCIQVCKQWWGGRWTLRGSAIQFMSKYISQNNPNYRRCQCVRSFHYKKMDKYKSIPQIIKFFRQVYKIDEQLWTIKIKEVNSEYKQYLHHKQTNYAQDNNTICIYLTEKDIELYDRAKIQKFKLDYLIQNNMKQKFVDEQKKKLPFLKLKLNIKNPKHIKIMSLPKNKKQIIITNKQQDKDVNQNNDHNNQHQQQKVKIQQIQQQINLSEQKKTEQKQHNDLNQKQHNDLDQKQQFNKANKNKNKIVCQLKQLKDFFTQKYNQQYYKQWQINVAIYFLFLLIIQHSEQQSIYVDQYYDIIFQLIYAKYQDQQQNEKINQYLKQNFDKYLLIPSFIQDIKKKYELTQQQFQSIYDQQVKLIQPLVTCNKQVKIEEQIQQQNQLNSQIQKEQSQLNSINREKYKISKQSINKMKDDIFIWDENFVRYLNKRINQYMVQIEQKRQRNLYFQNGQQCQIFKQSEYQLDLQYIIDHEQLQQQTQKYQQQK